MSGKKSVSKNVMSYLIVFVTIIIAVVGFFKVNNVSSINDLMSLARNSSEKLISCGFLSTDCQTGNLGPSAGSTLTIPDPNVPNSNNSGENNSKNVDANSSDQDKQNGSKSSYVSKLESLRVGQVEPKNEYSRRMYNHWIKTNGCDTRNRVLARDGINVKLKNDGCKVLSGQWVDVYSDSKVDNSLTPKRIDVDHVIPLKYAHYHGAGDWDSNRKESFANDLENLVSVSAKQNRIKGAKGPGEYYPPNSDYKCDYAKKWVDLSIKYDLSINSEDKTVLSNVLENCK